MLRASAFWINRLLWTALVTVLVLLAAYVSIGRYYITYVEQYQDNLIARVVSYTGLPLSAERLYGRWSQLSPVLTMESLVLSAPDPQAGPVLTIKNINIQLDPLASLLSGRLQVKRLKLSGVECELEETEPGKWQLKGYPTQAGDTDFDKVIDLVLSVDSVQLSAAALKMHYFQGKTVLLEPRELSLLREDNFRRLRLQATFNKAASPLLAIIEATGDPREAETFAARAWLKLDDVDFTDQLPLIRSLGIDLNNAEVDSEIWVDWKPRAVISIQGTARIPFLDWSTFAALGSQKNTAEPSEQPPFENVQLSFRAEKSADNNWRLWLPDLRTQRFGQEFSIEKLYAEINTDVVNVAIPVLSLDKLVDQVLGLNVLGEKGQSTLSALSPTGNLLNAQIQFSLNNDQASRFSVMANLESAGISAWKGAPGAKGVNGFIEVTPTLGMVEFNSQLLSLDFPVVYKHWLDFDQASGQVRWQVDEERIIVKSGPIHLQADYGPATGLLSLDLPRKTSTGDPLMTLAIGIRDTAAHHRNKLIPYTLNQGFLDWMARSVPEGHVIDGAFIYRGSLRTQASDDRTVQLYFNIENTTLDYHPRWPQLHDIRALVMIDNNAVDVKTQQARLFGLDIESAHVQVTPLTEGGMWLDVNASAKGDGSDALKVITQSAIHDVVGGVFDNWALQGATQAQVKLGVPLAGAEKQADINVSVSLTDNRLHIPEFRLDFNRVSGPLHFSSAGGLVSSGIHAELYGKPLTAAVALAQDKSVRVDIDGRIDMVDVKRWSKQAAMTFVTGETDFHASIDIAAEGTGRFSIESQLSGVTIDLPAPFAKNSKDSHAFRLDVPLNSKKTALTMELESLAQLQLELKQGQFSSALVTIKSNTNAEKARVAVKPEAGALIVTGNGPDVRLHEWQKILDRYLDAAKQYGPAATGKDIAIRVKHLSLSGISAFGQHFEQSVLSAERRNDAWWLAVSNKLISGELWIPDDKSYPYRVDLQRLHFPEGAKNEGLSSFDSTRFVDVDVNIADIAFADEHYGQIAFNLRSDSQGIRLENLTGNIRGVLIRQKRPGLLTWHRQNGIEQTHLTAQLDVGDLSKVLDNWHYEKMIESKAGNIDIDLHWQGRPDQWALKKSQGSVNISVKDGRFLSASDTASGTLKVVGIVNLANIARRLKLDFSDLYKKGISFDRIDGQLQLKDTKLMIVDEITIKSPSSGFSLRGTADMEQQVLDMEMIVTLPVANNLPWIAALAGGLPTAAGVYVASKIFEDQFDRISSAIYSVNGDWNNPELKFKRVFDQKKKGKPKKSGSKETDKGNTNKSDNPSADNNSTAETGAATTQTEKRPSAIKQPESEKNKSNDAGPEQPVIQQSESGQSVVKQPESERPVVKQSEPAQSVVKQPESERPVVKQPEPEQYENQVKVTPAAAIRLKSSNDQSQKR